MQSHSFEVSDLALASSSLYGSADSPLRIGIVGGALARARYAAALTALPSLRTVALVDPDKRAARAWARQLGSGPTLFDDLDRLLEADLELDALLIASPLRARAAHITAAACAHKPVLCEIPFAPRLAETDAALRAAAENGVLLMPALPRRFDPDFRHVTQYAETGALGTLRQVRCDWTFPAQGAGTVEIQSDAEDVGWYALWRHALCHTADVCRWWLGDALTVSADIDAAEGRARQEGALANIILTHERGQSVHHLARVRSTLSDERYKVVGAHSHLELILGPGASLAAGGAVTSLTLHRPNQHPEPLATPERAAPETDPVSARYRSLLAHFGDCVRTACAPVVRGADARVALETVQAAHLSSQEGSKVSLPLRHTADSRAIERAPKSPMFLPPPPDHP
jgi:myo-inositol 2-dehydrogenase/D-chiro-inositol 1-dehydrogenase